MDSLALAALMGGFVGIVAIFCFTALVLFLGFLAIRSGSGLFSRITKDQAELTITPPSPAGPEDRRS